MKEKRFSLYKYLTLTKAGIMDGLAFKAGYFVVFFGNITYLMLIYFLWKAIYAASPEKVVSGMTFNDTMVYLVLASALFNLMEVFLVWCMAREIKNGDIILTMLKPMDYKIYMFLSLSGNIVVSFFISFLPTFIIVCLLTRGEIKLGINLLFFALSMIFALLINFSIDFMVGTLCLYTESSWGINIMKEVVVLLLSGATVPLAFFPEGLRRVMECLPFQAIYNTPLKILVDKDMSISDYMWLIALQLMWVVVMSVLSRIFFNASKRVITVNGG